jgi:hypothetical protein
MLMVLTHVAKTKLVKTFFVGGMLPSFFLHWGSEEEITNG